MSTTWDNEQERPSVAQTTSAMVNTWVRGTDMAKSICSVDGCGRESDARGWCHGHYRRFRLNGDVSADVPLAGRSKGSMEDRFWGRVNKTDTCWLWTGYVGPLGYGRIALPRNGGPGRSAQAHRVVYESLVGPIPPGLVLDHLCRNPSCVNPDHLEPVTNKENILRGVAPIAVNAAKTHCIRGHAFDEANTRLTRLGRKCRRCDRDWLQRRNDKRGAERAERRAQLAAQRASLLAAVRNGVGALVDGLEAEG